MDFRPTLYNHPLKKTFIYNVSVTLFCNIEKHGANNILLSFSMLFIKQCISILNQTLTNLEYIAHLHIVKKGAFSYVVSPIYARMDTSVSCLHLT
jgi:hypothetical protein